MTHNWVDNLTTIGSDNGLLHGQRQAIIWTSAGILLIGPLWTNFSEILIKIPTFSFKKLHLKVSSAKLWPFCLGLNVLINIRNGHHHVTTIWPTVYHVKADHTMRRLHCRNPANWHSRSATVCFACAQNILFQYKINFCGDVERTLCSCEFTLSLSCYQAHGELKMVSNRHIVNTKNSEHTLVSICWEHWELHKISVGNQSCLGSSTRKTSNKFEVTHISGLAVNVYKLLNSPETRKWWSFHGTRPKVNQPWVVS